MAYSRWGNSVWYSFWVASDMKYKFPIQSLKDEQLFEICDFPSYYVSYGSLKLKGIDEVLKDIKAFYSQNHPGTIFDKFVDGKITYKETIFEAKNHSDEEIEELRNYLKEFIEDVDKHFKWKNFFYCEWYLEFWRQKYIKKRFKRKSL
jgi:hypothetical protein